MTIPDPSIGSSGTASETAGPDYVYGWDGAEWTPMRSGAGKSDAFGRERVSTPETLFDAKCIHDAQPLLFDDVGLSGSGTSSTHSADTASVVLAVGASTAGVRVRQSKRRPAYQPGKSQMAFLTFTLGAAATGITRRVGLFDANDGLFLQQTATALSLVRRSSRTGSPVDTAVAQADWSEDTFADLDVTKSQILFIDFEWLGVGLVRMGFVIDGALRYAHQFKHANNIAGVYMSTPNLPVRYELTNGGTGGAATLESICSAIISEGGQDVTGITRAVDRGITELTTANDTNTYTLLAMRLNAAKLDATVRINDLSIFCNSTADYRWALLLNPTIGSNLTYVAQTSSAVDTCANASAAALITGGTLLASGYGSTSAQNRPISEGSTDFAFGSKVDGTSDVVVLAIQNIAAGAEKYWGSLSWREQV